MSRLRFGVRPEDLQERLEASLGRMGRAAEDAAERVPPTAWTPQAQTFLVEQMEEFFFGTGSALPSEYVPPAH